VGDAAKAGGILVLVAVLVVAVTGITPFTVVTEQDGVDVGDQGFSGLNTMTGVKGIWLSSANLTDDTLNKLVAGQIWHVYLLCAKYNNNLSITPITGSISEKVNQITALPLLLTLSRS
jgi:hypothetical protein